jgi:hypothetical protein
MKFIFLLTITLLFTACNFGDSSHEIATKKLQEKKAFEEKIANSKEVQLKSIDAQKEQALAKIESQTELAKLEKEKLLEKIRLEAKAQKEQLILQQAREKEAFEAKLRDLERADSMEITRYLLLILLIVLIIAAYFLYLYFKQRHEAKLRAYQDNLDKYFHQQENMTKMRIAEKIIDRVASGNVDKEQEIALLNALGSNMRVEEHTSLPKSKNDDAQDAEIVQEK